MSWRARVASIVHDASKACVARGAGAATLRAIAKAWEVDHKRLSRLADPTAGVAIALGDVLAFPCVELAREVLLRCLAALETGDAPEPRRTLAEVTIALGCAVHDLERDLADGRLDAAAKHRANLARIASLATRGMLALERA